jgi:hypothetical protein
VLDPGARPGGDPYLLSVTRVRARTAWRGLVVGRAFTVVARDLRTTPGLVAASLRREDLRTYWTLTLWRRIGDMAGFRNQNPHRSWMGSVETLCDESSWYRGTWPGARLPEWPEAERLLLEEPHFTAMNGVSQDQAAGRIASRRLGRVWTVALPPGEKGRA